MSDITKCNNERCYMRKRCWRAMAPSSEHQQAWATFGTFLPDGRGECDMNWPMDDRGSPSPTDDPSGG